jgi:hypothetical protein
MIESKCVHFGMNPKIKLVIAAWQEFINEGITSEAFTEVKASSRYVWCKFGATFDWYSLQKDNGL